MEAEKVRLRCVSEGGRLRVKIVSKGYSPHANCRFPRAIRVEGKEWEVMPSDVKLQGTGKFYYVIKTSAIQEVRPIPLDVSNLKVYDVTEDSECVICAEQKSDEDLAIVAPCGHKCGCFSCLERVQKCPICRGDVVRLVKKSELE